MLQPMGRYGGVCIRQGRMEKTRNGNVLRCKGSAMKEKGKENEIRWYKEIRKKDSKEKREKKKQQKKTG